MKQMLLPKEQLLPEIKKQVVPDLKKAMKEIGIKHFSLLDVEWTEEGIILYYNDSRDPETKQEEKSS